jgi:hypothetical protein
MERHIYIYPSNQSNKVECYYEVLDENGHFCRSGTWPGNVQTVARELQAIELRKDCKVYCLYPHGSIPWVMVDANGFIDEPKL